VQVNCLTEATAGKAGRVGSGSGCIHGKTGETEIHRDKDVAFAAVDTDTQRDVRWGWKYK